MSAMKNQQTGFMLVTAIFLVIIMALVVGFGLRLTGSSQYMSALTMQGGRADAAALSGLEVGLSYYTATATNCSTDSSFTTGLGGNLDAFSADVSCSYTSHVEDAVTYCVLTITSRGYLTDARSTTAMYAQRTHEAHTTIVGPCV